MLGTKILHYKILEKLGEGGMGVVYLAEDTKLERKVAIKFLPRYIAGNSEEIERFRIEAKAAAALNHPNITTIYAIEESCEDTFIVMEFIDGIELKDKIKDGPIPTEEAINIALRIAEGLEAAHKKGIVHRDIKCQNIMITNDGKVKIMDFGLAKVGKGAQVTKTGATIGTVAYMSPEQARGEEIDYRSDIWSFGVVFYEMLTSELPFKGEYEAAAMYEILNEEPKAIQIYRNDVPENIISLISLMLHKDADKRIDSLDEIKHKLQKKIEVQKKNSQKSIAVLYFENMSPEKENEYFCAGITEDLIIDLSRIKELKVIPRSDVLPFRNKEVNTQKMGQMLKVPFILEGSVRKAGQKIRISAQLIDINSGFPIWAERYDRALEDIFEIQMEVSQKITEALKISLTENEKKILGKKPTEDLRAYDFYIRGREFISKNGKKNNEAAIQMFEYAISIDHDFALAYTGLAEAYSYKYMWYDGDLKWQAKIIDAGEKALKLDPDLIEAKFVIGMVYFHQKRYYEAIEVFKKITNAKKDFYLGYRWMGVIFDILGDYDSAIENYIITSELKPYSEEPLMQLELTYRRKKDIQNSEYYQQKFIEVAEQKIKVNPEDTITLSRLASIYAGAENKEQALKIIDKVLKIDPYDGLAIYNSACTYARFNMKEKALKYLKAAFDIGYKNIRDWVKSDPDFDLLRDDVKFKEIIGS